MMKSNIIIFICMYEDKISIIDIISDRFVILRYFKFGFQIAQSFLIIYIYQMLQFCKLQYKIQGLCVFIKICQIPIRLQLIFQ